MDLYLDWNGDLVLGQSGDIQMATGWDQVRQRIIRRMVTNPQRVQPNGIETQADYYFAPDFGFGLASLVDASNTEDFLADLKRRISQAVFADAAVDPTIPPSILFQRPAVNEFWIIIGVPLRTGQSGTISIKM